MKAAATDAPLLIAVPPPASRKQKSVTILPRAPKQRTSIHSARQTKPASSHLMVNRCNHLPIAQKIINELRNIGLEELNTHPGMTRADKLIQSLQKENATAAKFQMEQLQVKISMCTHLNKQTDKLSIKSMTKSRKPLFEAGLMENFDCSYKAYS